MNSLSTNNFDDSFVGLYKSSIDGQHIFEVSDLTIQIKALLENDFGLLAVTGEISGLVKHSSGHVYFSLKDTSSVIACTLFRSNARNYADKLKNGDKIIVKGKLSVYEPRGTYSLNIQSIYYDGEGLLKAKYDALKNELQKKNYFSKNKPLPRFPKRVILLTSRTSAALQDMIKIAKNRFNALEFILIDTLTQGAKAKFSIAKNIQYADSLRADIIVLARGGGSIEDLWNFNEIEVLDAIFACKTLVVSAIGHEIDYLLSDYVADLRAPTPSAAMEMILPDKNALLMQMLDLENHLRHSMQSLVERKAKSLQVIYDKINIFHPLRSIMRYKQSILTHKQILKDSLKFFLYARRQALLHCYEQLSIMSPSNKISSMRDELKFYQIALPNQTKGLIRHKSMILRFIQHRVTQSYRHFFYKKNSQLSPTMLKQCESLLLQSLLRKKEELKHLESLLDSLNPSKNLKLGFAQILKDNKPTKVSSLATDDIIEIVDSSCSIRAKIL
ncbi:exodeoxyribonuclease VII large subunit [Helicobacter muridarum]|uniref:Exodeoxyribonuclease 7 large subunit n=1 Tax=Helicobacter muridarum TaxID=216 RepID=A0A377PW18_9HELI|nr:exodeoxyribonuclease VII large subunit [Helicobacter muridarum]STQ87076.1 exodeoxyribonuclease VII large subunit [Helicobacter muridarum]